MKTIKGLLIGCFVGALVTLLICLSNGSLVEAKSEEAKKEEEKNYELYQELHEQMLVVARYEGYNQGYRQGYIEIENMMEKIPDQKSYENYVIAKKDYQNDPTDENFEKLVDVTAAVYLECELDDLK